MSSDRNPRQPRALEFAPLECVVPPMSFLHERLHIQSDAVEGWYLYRYMADFDRSECREWALDGTSKTRYQRPKIKKACETLGGGFGGKL